MHCVLVSRSMRLTIDADLLMLILTITVLLTFSIGNYSAMLRLGTALKTMHQCDVVAVLLEHYADTYNSWFALMFDVFIYRGLSLTTIAVGAMSLLKLLRKKNTTNRQVANSIEIELQQVVQLIREDMRFKRYFCSKHTDNRANNSSTASPNRKRPLHSSNVANPVTNKRVRQTPQTKHTGAMHGPARLAAPWLHPAARTYNGQRSVNSPARMAVHHRRQPHRVNQYTPRPPNVFASRTPPPAPFNAQFYGDDFYGAEPCVDVCAMTFML